MKSLSLFFVLFLLAIASCKKKDADAVPVRDYFIYGYADQNVDEKACSIYFEITDKAVKTDTIWGYNKVPDDITKFNFDVIKSAAAYDSVKDLANNIPSELYGMNNMDIGTSSSGKDWYLDVRARRNGTNYKWRFRDNDFLSSDSVRVFYNRLLASLWYL